MFSRINSSSVENEDVKELSWDYVAIMLIDEYNAKAIMQSQYTLRRRHKNQIRKKNGMLSRVRTVLHLMLSLAAPRVKQKWKELLKQMR